MTRVTTIRRRALWAVLTALALPLLAGLLTPNARAASATGSGVTVSLAPQGAAGRSGYFVFGARRGRLIRGTFTVGNTSRTAAGRVKLYGVDATTGQTSGAVYQSAVHPRRGVGRWLHLSSSRVTLGHGRQAVVRFTVRVPRSASAGQHLGAIVAQPVAPLNRFRSRHEGHRFQIKVRALTVLAVQVNVPGPRVQQLAVGGCRVGGPHGYQTLYIGLRNTGNTLLKGRGRLTVAAGQGRSAEHRSFNVDTFVPRTQIAYPIVMRGHPLHAGHYRTTVAVRYGPGRTARRTMTCAVSARSIKQVFGSPASASLGGGGGGGGGGVSTWLLVLGGVAVFAVGFGGAGLLFRARLRHS